MYGHVERAKPFLDDPCEVQLGEASESREVAIQEGESVVVVLEIERLPHAGRELVDEAELTVVVTCLHAVEDRRIQADPYRLALALGNDELHDVAIAAHSEPRIRIIDQLLVLDDVVGYDPVDGHQLITGAEAGDRRGSAWQHLKDGW